MWAIFSCFILCLTCNISEQRKVMQLTIIIVWYSETLLKDLKFPKTRIGDREEFRVMIHCSKMLTRLSGIFYKSSCGAGPLPMDRSLLRPTPPQVPRKQGFGRWERVFRSSLVSHWTTTKPFRTLKIRKIGDMWNNWWHLFPCQVWFCFALEFWTDSLNQCKVVFILQCGSYSLRGSNFYQMGGSTI